MDQVLSIESKVPMSEIGVRAARLALAEGRPVSLVGDLSVFHPSQVSGSRVIYCDWLALFRARHERY